MPFKLSARFNMNSVKCSICEFFNWNHVEERQNSTVRAETSTALLLAFHRILRAFRAEAIQRTPNRVS